MLTVEFTARRCKELVVRHGFAAARTWSFWRSMIIYFCLFGIVNLDRGGFRRSTNGNRAGHLRSEFRHLARLPELPVYGAGMVACAVLLFLSKICSRSSRHRCRSWAS
ncbi:MAG: hypothetical protein ACLUE1_04415 [Adlercreutzia equolifaciens]